METHQDGRNGVNGIGYAAAVAVTPDGSHVFIAAIGRNAGGSGVTTFRRDQTTGRLTFEDTIGDGDRKADRLFGVYCVTVSPDERNLYASSVEQAVGVFEINKP